MKQNTLFMIYTVEFQIVLHTTWILCMYLYSTYKPKPWPDRITSAGECEWVTVQQMSFVRLHKNGMKRPNHYFFSPSLRRYCFFFTYKNSILTTYVSFQISFEFFFLWTTDILLFFSGWSSAPIYSRCEREIKSWKDIINEAKCKQIEDKKKHNQISLYHFVFHLTLSEWWLCRWWWNHDILMHTIKTFEIILFNKKPTCSCIEFNLCWKTVQSNECRKYLKQRLLLLSSVKNHSKSCREK